MICGTLRWLVVMAFEMDADLMRLPVSPLANVATSDAYSRMWFTATRLARFFQQLGYQAISIGNDVALSGPMAVDAGLGEVARSGMLITPKYGPRVRLAKVLTDLPLEPDRLISFGVTAYCETRHKCARACPAGAISNGERSFDRSPSGSAGVLRWAGDGEACKQAWAQLGATCHNCIRVCPFAQPDERLYERMRSLL
jgi:reductive dehalogenase